MTIENNLNTYSIEIYNKTVYCNSYNLNYVKLSKDSSIKKNSKTK